MLTIEPVFRISGSEAIREITLAFPDETLIMIIFLRSSLDLIISSEMGRDTRRRGRSGEVMAVAEEGATWRRGRALDWGFFDLWRFLSPWAQWGDRLGQWAATWLTPAQRRQVNWCLHLLECPDLKHFVQTNLGSESRCFLWTNCQSESQGCELSTDGGVRVASA